MADEYSPTVRIRRPGKVTTDDRGRTVWADTVETAELELVSSGELQKILATTDDGTRSAIERMVSGEQEGVLARDMATGLFEIVSDADLQALLETGEGPARTSRPADVRPEATRAKDTGGTEELSLVSTQILRKILATDKPAGKSVKSPGSPQVPHRADKGGGFDPYNSG